MKFCFVGLGQMGAPMARNLACAHDVVVYDKLRSMSGALTQAGMQMISGPQECKDVDVLLLCLPNADIVEQVLFDPTDGFARHLKQGATIVDTGTIEYGATRRIGQACLEAGFGFLDAPVSGMQKRAEDGSLTMMVGGDPALFAALEPALSTMASKILHMGDIGTGQLMKLTNQLLFDINAAALAEILPLSVKLGIEPEKVADVVNSGTGRSFASEFFVPQILEGVFDKGYPMAAAYKDLISGAEISARNHIPTPVLAAATATYQQALLEGHGDKDKGAMILVFERLLGVSFRAEKNKVGPPSGPS